MFSKMTLATALAVFMAAGCASKGNDQNYRMLDEDPERFETEPHSAADVNVAYGQFSSTPRNSAKADEEARKESRVYEAEVSLTTTKTAEPSLNGLDRSHWEAMQVTAHPHVLTTQPHYFEDYTTYASRPGRPTLPLQSDEQVLATLEPAEAENLSGRNLFDMVAQPVELAFDMVLFPVRLIATPPWTNVAEETRGHGTTYFEGSQREPVPAATNPSRVISIPVKATVELAPPVADQSAESEEVIIESAEEDAIATEPME